MTTELRLNWLIAIALGGWLIFLCITLQGICFLSFIIVSP